ncbi:MAG: alpha/beta fold hydrolase [Chlamydiia bacterium]|nr:alpha/beta fold hydrolase [Chlamydiia bacterium]MCP5509673.1 alpha/beta fold hydrolase [Chlamydiales bacterium]
MKKSIYSLGCLILALFSFLLSEIYNSQEDRIFRSKTLPQNHVFHYPGQFKEVYLQTGKDATLHGLHFKAKTPKGVVLYFHGRGWNLGSLHKRSAIPEDFITRGYDCFIIDYRGFGKSTGKRSEDAIYHDASCAYDYLLESYPEDQITVYGMSFGTGVAAQLASCRNPHQLILEAPYTSMLDMAEKTIPYLPKFMLAWLLKYHIPTEEFISKISCPIHIFHGTHDTLIPHSSSQKLLLRVAQNVRAKLTSIDNGSHDHLPSYQEYSEQLDHLLN